MDYDDDDDERQPDAKIAFACKWESGARLYISGGLILFGLWWLWRVWQHWRFQQKSLWLQHGAVLLFLIGQILLEDPKSAWQVHYGHRYSHFTISGKLQGTQPFGCACMSLATLLLVDHCLRAGGPSSRAPSLGRVAVLSLCSIWPVAFYEVKPRVFVLLFLLLLEGVGRGLRVSEGRGDGEC